MIFIINFQKARALIRPTSEWNPACRGETSTQSTYDAIQNTIVMINGRPEIRERNMRGHGE